MVVDLKKIQCMKEWPRPTTIKALRGFLGLIGYHIKFVSDYRKINAPLTVLLKKDSFEWNEIVENALNSLKEAMTSTLAFNSSSSTMLNSGEAIGPIMMQEKRPIVYISKVLPIHSNDLSTYENEMSSILYVIEK